MSVGASQAESTSVATPPAAWDADRPASRRTAALCGGLVTLAFVVSGIAAAVAGWRPSWDTAFIQLRVLDVGTGRTPLLGMPSTVSQSLAAPAHHPGPLHFWLLAIPTLLTRWLPAGLAIAQAIVAATLAGLSLAAVRSVATARHLWWATTLWLVAAVFMGDELLHDPWNPHMATVALLAAFVSAAAAWHSDATIAVLALVVSASVAAQSHLSALIPSAALVVATGVAGGRRRGWRASRRHGLVALAAFAACWSGPLLDQFLHRPGNLRTLLTAGDSLGTSFGFVTGFDRLARTVTPPGLLRSGLPAVMTGGGLWFGRFVLLALIAAVTATTIRRLRRRLPQGIGPVALVVVGATWIGQSITPVTFGSVFGRHMWELMWPAAIALWAAAIAGGVGVMAEVRTIRNRAAPNLPSRIWPALLVIPTAVLIIRPMVTDLAAQRDGRWFAAIAAASDAVDTAADEQADRGGRNELTIVTNGIAIESELVAGVAADLARRGTMVRFSGTISAGLLHGGRQVAATSGTTLLFTTLPDDPLAQGRRPLAIIDSPVPTEIAGAIELFLIETTT